jgi:hypothetical protein
MNVTFATPVNASKFIAGAGTATGAQLRSINYLTGEVTFSLVTETGTLPQVNGIVVADVSETTVAAAIRAEVAAKT